MTQHKTLSRHERQEVKMSLFHCGTQTGPISMCKKVRIPPTVAIIETYIIIEPRQDLHV